MKFESKFNIDDIVYFYTNEYNSFFGKEIERQKINGPQALFIQQGQVQRIIVDHYNYDFITYKVRIGSNITVDIHENYMAISIEELAVQSKEYALSPVNKINKK